jgi:hypothetical protein
VIKNVDFFFRTSILCDGISECKALILVPFAGSVQRVFIPEVLGTKLRAPLIRGVLLWRGQSSSVLGGCLSCLIFGGGDLFQCGSPFLII